MEAKLGNGTHTYANQSEYNDFELSEKLIHDKWALVAQRSKQQDMDANTRRIATQRVRILFTLAKEKYRQDPAIAQRYVDIARRIAMAAKIRLPKDCRHQICRHCKSFILPGINCRIRIRQSREPHVTITCLNCEKQTRIPLRKREKRLRK